VVKRSLWDATETLLEAPCASMALSNTIFLLEQLEDLTDEVDNPGRWARCIRRAPYMQVVAPGRFPSPRVRQFIDRSRWIPMLGAAGAGRPARRRFGSASGRPDQRSSARATSRASIRCARTSRPRSNGLDLASSHAFAWRWYTRRRQAVIPEPRCQVCQRPLAIRDKEWTECQP
jgi:hypothetical protein